MSRHTIPDNVDEAEWLWLHDDEWRTETLRIMSIDADREWWNEMEEALAADNAKEMRIIDDRLTAIEKAVREFAFYNPKKVAAKLRTLAAEVESSGS